jgi:general secretion pathway protein I
LSRKISPEQHGEAGFTLIEAVVTLALVTVVLAAIGYLVAANSRGVRILEQHVALTETARLVATSIPRNGEALADELSGERSGHRWQMRLTPFFDGSPVVPESRFMPQRIELRVQSPSGAILSLETVRLQNVSGR